MNRLPAPGTLDPNMLRAGSSMVDEAWPAANERNRAPGIDWTAYAIGLATLAAVAVAAKVAGVW